MKRPSILMLWLPLLLLVSPAQATEGAETSCVACHSDSELFSDEEQLRIVEDFAQDVHSEVGLGCHDCHGGNPDPALAEDSMTAMDESFAENPYRGTPESAVIPSFCGRCHSDADYIKRFNPDARVDQEQQYWTSHHGKALQQGDTQVATCVDCHGIHGIRRSSDVEARVYPTRVADTCGTCHSDPQRMATYTLADGRPLPVDQYERWRRSVHGQALLEKEDLFAPTCNDCHGNHGATPPGQESIVLVCGQCHGREARLFRASPKYEGFERHNEFMAEGDVGCGDCHQPSEPQAEVTSIRSFSECIVCHGNHAVARPTIAQFGELPASPCALCHENPGLLPLEQELRKTHQHYEETREALLASAGGIEGEALFDWLVDETLKLPDHTSAGEGEPVLRPEFARMFEKFRIGKTYQVFIDPRTGEEVREKLVQCKDCHGADPELAAEARGHGTAKEYVLRMHELMVLSGRAERNLLAARRGGVEVREVLLDLDRAVDSQVDLEVLVHSFSKTNGSGYLEKHSEGIAHAGAALSASETALDELQFRWQWLVVLLVFVAFLLVALALKIQDLPD
ncbi:MAG: hypothetical protein GY856_49285 [bacterium]|nr:hypothetical protein [bacterium]